MLRCIIENITFFEWTLTVAVDDLSLEDVVSNIKDGQFKFLDGVQESNDILKQLLPLKVRKRKKHGRKKAKTFDTHQELWDYCYASDANKKRRILFGQLIYAIVRRLCEDCYVPGCNKKVSNYKLIAQLYGWHGDHQKNYWKKVECPSNLYNNIGLLLIECIKCRLSCAFCHENGKIFNYEMKLQYKCQLHYEFGDEHRSAKDVLESREMRLFILELKARKAFWTGKIIYMSWNTIKCLVWKFFGIVLADVSQHTEKDYYDKENRYNINNRRNIINDAIMNIIKKLGVKCPGCEDVECGDEFGKYNPVRLSGVHMDHTSGIKHYTPSSLRRCNIDKMIKELKEGECSPTCCFCHGILN